MDRVYDVGRLITIMDRRAAIYQQEIEELKSRADLEAIATVEQQAVELLTMNKKLKANLDEACRRLDASNKELNETRILLTDAEKQIKDMLAQGRKTDDDLLKAVRELKASRAELPRKAMKNTRIQPDLSWDFSEPVKSLMNMGTGWLWLDYGPST
ncbi:hypothetical protein B296_00001781 [Ensete ventricosum]|uniref:Uncharacterized protein n=1 Tax=Ensete ventricosum TaxID=4639 RepID=A0A427A5Q5_ENSVE|nr:hypothetical protein B296_00001781 [Ensete ventricosum]